MIKKERASFYVFLFLVKKKKSWHVHCSTFFAHPGHWALGQGSCVELKDSKEPDLKARDLQSNILRLLESMDERSHLEVELAGLGVQLPNA